MTRAATKKNKLGKKANRELFLIALPALIKLLIFSYIPMIGIIIAFQQFMLPPNGGIFNSPFIGFKNFEYLVRSIEFRRIITNAVVLNLLGIVVGTVVAIFLGLLLFEITRKWKIRTVQSIIIIPYFMSWPLVAILLNSMIDADVGVLTSLFEKLFGTRIMFYERPELWRAIITIAVVWKGAGLSCIIYYATLMGADSQIYEAADIDGAGRYRKMWYLSLPHLKFMIIISVIMSTANIVRYDFNTIYFLTQNSPLLYRTTDVIETYMFRALRLNTDYSIGTATGLMQGVAGLILSFITNWVCGKIDRRSRIY